jgi:hypothetical protein
VHTCTTDQFRSGHGGHGGTCGHSSAQLGTRLMPALTKLVSSSRGVPSTISLQATG